MAAYGTIEGVTTYVQNLAHGQFTTSTDPPIGDVQRWLEQRSATLSGWIAAAGYIIPVIQPDAKAVLDMYCNLGTAGDCELSQISAAYSDEDQNRRENKFLAEFYRAEKWIQSGALNALGVPTNTTGSQVAGLPMVGLLTAGTVDEIPYRLGRPRDW